MASNGIAQQLGAKGLQDVHLNIKPEYTFWKRPHRKPSAFAIDTQDVGVTSMRWGHNEHIVTLPKTGDLLRKVHIEMKINPVRLKNPGNDTVCFSNVLGHAALASVQFVSGQTVVAQAQSESLEIHHEFTADLNKNLDELVLRSNSLQQRIDWAHNGNTIDTDGSAIVCATVNMPFWFTETDSNALPVVCLQMSDNTMRFRVRSKFELLEFSNPNNTELDPIYNGEIKQFSVLLTYVTLENVERIMFLEKEHTYLAKSYQYNDYHTKAAGIPRLIVNLPFIFPCTHFIFFFQRNSLEERRDYFNWERTDGMADDCFITAQPKLLDIPREPKPRGPQFFRVMQPNFYCNRIPQRNVGMYSYALHPYAPYPSGSVNCSRTDGQQFEFIFPTKDGKGNVFEECKIKFFAYHFNIFIIKNAGCFWKYIS